MSLHNPPLWTKDFVLISLSNLFLFTSFQMLIPTLPAYVEDHGGDEFAVGLVIGLFTISALLTRPFAGKALDTIGRRKVLFSGLLIFIASVMGYYWMTSVLLILLIRLIHGIGWGMATTTYGTIVSDLIPPQRRGEGMGYFGLSSNLAMAIGPFFGIWVMNEYGFGVLFFISTILVISAALLSQIIHYHNTPEIGKEEKSSRLNGLLERKAFFPSLLVMLLAFTYGGIVSFITLFGDEVHIKNVGWFFLANAGMIMLIRPFAGMLFDKKGHVWVLLPGALFSIAGLFLLSYTTNLYTLIISSILYGAGFGTIQPSLQAWTIHRVAPERRGAANGTFYSAFDLGIGAGAMLLGLVAKWSSYSMMYRLSVFFLGLYLVIYVYYLIKGKKEPPHPS
ncbi:MFS transporter [Microaerobacter geothermalis]|uniref:MFS transporter n=1 Tax=Microaerobacter geothermalis TaxID=674972 RepID=UPI001F24D164|nr:MFS transporter [Microaerobacter geothermalis]MCF6094636.1 MFS transporter [Microaerobacter geothermalis]